MNDNEGPIYSAEFVKRIRAAAREPCRAVTVEELLAMIEGASHTEQKTTHASTINVVNIVRNRDVL